MKIWKIASDGIVNDFFDNIIKNISSNNDLLSGNCGMFAIALGKIAEQLGHKSTIWVATNLKGAGYDEFEIAVDSGNVDFYHIVVEIDGQMYDARGKIDKNKLIGFCNAIYGDPYPSCFSYHLSEKVISIIRQNTNWVNSWEYFYNLIKSKIGHKTYEDMENSTE